MKALLVFTLLAVIYIPTYAEHKIETRPLSRQNPTHYIFPLPLPKVREAILNLQKLRYTLFLHPKEKITYMFSDGQVNDEFLINPTFAFETIERGSPFSASVFKDSANEQDIYIHSFHEPIAKSTVYFRKKKPLPYIASFQIHLTALTQSATKVQIITHEPEVIAGKSRLPGIHGERPYKYVKVTPTTVEEYRLLLRIGAELDVKDMPGIIVSK